MATFLREKIPLALDTSSQNIKNTLEILNSNRKNKYSLPKSTVDNQKWEFVSPYGAHTWASGFFVGCLWQVHSEKGILLDEARRYTKLFHKVSAPKTQPPFKGYMHPNLGFDMSTTLMNQLKYDIHLPRSQKSKVEKKLKMSAIDLMNIYHKKVGAIVDHGAWAVKPQDSYLIIDFSMILEPLIWWYLKSGEERYLHIIQAHADALVKNHLRQDGSTYHISYYDKDGKLMRRGTWQGYKAESTWSRGQAWGIYGFTLLYEKLGDKQYLKIAEKLADFYVKNLPASGVTYWDFDAPPESNLIDTSATAIATSALITLSQLTLNREKSHTYRAVARRSLASLLKKHFNWSKNSVGLLKNGVGHKPNGTEINVTLIYGDYYFLEAMRKYKRHLMK